jgi:tetratricopeptide (TPR) repeat protein
VTGLAIRHSSGLTPRIVQGSAYVANGDFERAIAEYTEANAFVYSFQGSAYLAKGDLDRAIVDYTEAIRLDPKWAGAFNNRGTAYATKGDRESSVGDFYESSDDYGHAIVDYDEAIRVRSKLAEAYCGRGHVFSKNWPKGVALARTTRIQCVLTLARLIKWKFMAMEVFHTMVR